MKKSQPSIFKMILFTLALYANISYGLFVLNPVYAGNFSFWVTTALFDFISIALFSFVWISALYYEMNKHSYDVELAFLKDKGKELKDKTTAIFLPVVNEPFSVIEHTVKAVLNLTGHKKVYLLDDGKREDLKEFAHKMGIHYIIRSDRTNFKSGNLNNALFKTSEEFIAVFDADFAPKKEFLEETLPYFVDPEVAIVQTPQVYKNTENLFSKGSLNLQNMFYSYIMPSKHLQKSAFCVGTNVVYRRSVMEEIGGFAPVKHSEDVFTTLKVNQYGYRVFFVDRVLAVGLSPDNLISFFNQQYRWARGGLSMLFKHSTLFNKKLTTSQKLHFFASNSFYLTGLAVLWYLVSPLVALIYNVTPIDQRFYALWLPRWGLYFVVNFFFYLFANKKYRVETLALGLFSFIPYVSAFFSILGGISFKWKVTTDIGRGLATKIIAPLITYISLGTILLASIVTGVLKVNTEMYLYTFWLSVNIVLSFYLIISSYKVHLFRSLEESEKGGRRVENTSQEVKLLGNTN